MSKTQQSTLDTGRVKDVPRGYVGQLGDGGRVPTVIESRDGGGERCPQCGTWYQGLTFHWSQGSCDYPPVSQYKMNVMRGMMLGDCTVNRCNKNPHLRFRMTNKRFLKWLSSEFGWVVNDVKMTASAVEIAEGTRENLNRDTQPEDCVDIYSLRTRSLPVFQEFADWYSSGEKVFPQGLSLKPIGLKMWYVSDGSLGWNTNGNSWIRFSSANEKERPTAIFNVLEPYGFTVGHSGSSFYLRVEDTEDFFDLIGDPVPGFEYKWAYEDRDRYNRLKEECREKYCTQTLE